MISAEGLAALADETAWGKLAPEVQIAWTALLEDMMGDEQAWSWVDTWAKEAAKQDSGLGKVNAALIKAFHKSFGLRDPDLDPVLDKKGEIIPDDDLTDFENIPLGTDIRDYMAQEVLPHAHDAYVDETFRDDYDGQVGVVGYEINFNRYFYEYQPPRDLEVIDAELKAVEAEIAAVLAEVTE